MMNPTSHHIIAVFLFLILPFGMVGQKTFTVESSMPMFRVGVLQTFDKTPDQKSLDASFSTGKMEETRIVTLAETMNGQLTFSATEDFMKEHKNRLFLSAPGYNPILSPKLKAGKVYTAKFKVALNCSSYLNQNPSQNNIGMTLSSLGFPDTLTRWDSQLKYDLPNTFNLYRNWCAALGTPKQDEGDFYPSRLSLNFRSSDWEQIRLLAHSQVAMMAVIDLMSALEESSDTLSAPQLGNLIRGAQNKLAELLEKYPFLNESLLLPAVGTLDTYAKWHDAALPELIEDDWTKLSARRGDNDRKSIVPHYSEYYDKWLESDFLMYKAILLSKINENEKVELSSLEEFSSRQIPSTYRSNRNRTFKRIANEVFTPHLQGQVRSIVTSDFADICAEDEERIAAVDAILKTLKTIDSKFSQNYIDVELPISELTFATLWAIADNQYSLPSSSLPDIRFVSGIVPGIVNEYTTYKRPGGGQSQAYREVLLDFLWNNKIETLPSTICQGPISERLATTNGSSSAPIILPDGLEFDCIDLRNPLQVSIEGSTIEKLAQIDFEIGSSVEFRPEALETYRSLNVDEFEAILLAKNQMALTDFLEFALDSTSTQFVFPASNWKLLVASGIELIEHYAFSQSASNQVSVDFSPLSGISIVDERFRKAMALQNNYNDLKPNIISVFGERSDSSFVLLKSAQMLESCNSNWISSAERLLAVYQEKPEEFVSWFENVCDRLTSLRMAIVQIEFAQTILEASNLSTSHPVHRAIDAVAVNEALQNLGQIEETIAKYFDDYKEAKHALQENRRACLVGYNWMPRMSSEKVIGGIRLSSDGSFVEIFATKTLWGDWSITNNGVVELTYTKVTSGQLPQDQKLKLEDCNRLVYGNMTLYKD